jgi:cysteinyl-tRNA synthetase
VLGPVKETLRRGMLVHLFNTLDGGLHEFVPFRPRAVPMHPCGPTVYAYWQTGNLCS